MYDYHPEGGFTINEEGLLSEGKFTSKEGLLLKMAVTSDEGLLSECLLVRKVYYY